MVIPYGTIFAYFIGIILLYSLGRLLLTPLKFILKLIYNAIVGGIVILVINLIGRLIGFTIALNFVSALIVGTLGVPGLGLIVALKFMFKAL
ncbi:MAG TPA: SigmaK-factor processing regulatory BofA [Clostridiaceae bacterium]|nr:SigmaK-factor processing regulatory BofA [Clostridiaceae bacterium]